MLALIGVFFAFLWIAGRLIPQPKRAPTRSYQNTRYYIDKAVIVNANPSASRPTFQLGRTALSATAIQALPRGVQLALLEASRPYKSDSEEKKRAWARMQDAIMRRR
jgi:hypothetical protein